MKNRIIQILVVLIVFNYSGCINTPIEIIDEVPPTESTDSENGFHTKGFSKKNLH
jgi:hypothetical protein